MHKQLHQAKAHARVDDLLDLLVGAIAQIRDCPAGVSQDVDVRVEEESGQDWQCGLNFAELNRRVLASTQIR